MSARPGSSHPATLAAWVAGLTAVAGTAVAIGLAIAGGETVDPKPLLLPLVWVVPGVLVAAARPRWSLGWLLLAVALGFVGIGLAGAYVTEAGPDEPLAGWALWYVDRAAAYVVPATLAALLLLPDGRLPSPAWRPLATVVLACQVLLITVFSLVEGPASAPDSSAPERLAGVANPVGVLPASWDALVSGLDLVVLQLPLLLVPAAFWSRWRRATGPDRSRLAALLLATAVFGLVVVAGHLAWPDAAGLLDVAASILLVGVVVSTVLGRHGLETVVHRSAVWVALTLLIAGGYVAVTAVVATTGAALPPFGAGALAAVIALLLLPVRGLLQRVAGRVLYGDRADPLAAVSRLAASADAADSTEAALREIATAVAESARVPLVEVVAGGREVRHGRPAPGQRVEVFPLSAAGEPVGEIRIGIDPGRSWRPSDQRLLEMVARHAGLALRAVALAESVAQSRHRLLVAREEERRRVGRNLHDELGPTIAALTMELGALRGLAESDPPATAARLALLEARSRATLDDVRALARELRPPTLEQFGLAEALRRDAEGLGIDLHVTVRGEPCPPAVELAAYRIGQQALVNVARHAQVSCAQLAVEREPGLVRLRLDDRGRGIPAGASEGVGLSSMRERAAELGGHCTVRPLPGGGTVVEATLPVPAGEAT